MKKLVVSIFVLLLAVAGFLMLKEEAVAESYGNATIILVDQNGNEQTTTIGFDEGDTLFELLEENFEVGCANDSYTISDVCEKTTFGGHVILQLDTLVTDWYSSYIAIYINDTYSNKGIDIIELTDGTEYKFEYTALGGASNDD